MNRPVFNFSTRHNPGGVSLQFNHDVGGFMNRLQRAAQARLFVVRWNDKRDHLFGV
jgi:hypothetical protein